MGRLSESEVLLSWEVPDLRTLSDWARRNVTGMAAVWVLVERIPRGWVEEEESRDAVRFFRSDADFDVTGFESGYAFNEEFELRWDPAEGGDSGSLRVRYIGPPVSDAESVGEPSSSLEVVEAEYRLWGQLVRGGQGGAEGEAAAPTGKPFANARIPRVLYYPVSGEEAYTSLLVKEYRDARSGDIKLWRFASVREQS